MSDIGSRVAETLRRIGEAAARAGREPGAVSLVAVTKTVPPEGVREAAAAGVTAFGENRVQEAEAKIAQVTEPVEWHLIGRLQSNKARLAAALFDVVHSVDRPSLVERLDAAAGERAKTLPIYVQVEYVRTDETPGRVEEATLRTCEAVRAASSLRLEGLMTLPPFTDDPEDARPWFRRLRALRDRLSEALDAPLPGLSMGMTNDFEIAVEEGATVVRVGSAIFGSRA